MSIKKILAFVLLALLIYAGVYVAIYGAERYMLYSGPERDFNKMSSGELQPKLNVKGSIETVTAMIFSETVSSNVLGITTSIVDRYYYALPIGYQEDPKKQQYCVIAVSDPADIEAVNKLMKIEPVPPDPNAPRFEFRGMSLTMPATVYAKFRDYLYGIYDTDFNIYAHANVSYNLVPYIIFVKGKNDGDLLAPVIGGGACAVICAVLFIVLAVRTYKRKHMYD